MPRVPAGCTVESVDVRCLAIRYSVFGCFLRTGWTVDVKGRLQQRIGLGMYTPIPPAAIVTSTETFEGLLPIG